VSTLNALCLPWRRPLAIVCGPPDVLSWQRDHSSSQYPVPAPLKLLLYGAIEIWLFFFPLLLLCLRRSKDCFNTKSIVNRFKLGFSFYRISFCWAFVLMGFSFYCIATLSGFRVAEIYQQRLFRCSAPIIHLTSTCTSDVLVN